MNFSLVIEYKVLFRIISDGQSVLSLVVTKDSLPHAKEIIIF